MVTTPDKRPTRDLRDAPWMWCGARDQVAVAWPQLHLSALGNADLVGFSTLGPFVNFLSFAPHPLAL